MATTLGYILIGLCAQAPRSGYALRKVFDDTPLGRYSSSPGSIYPALKVLSRDGLVDRTTGKQAVFRPTSAGLDALKQWLSADITVSDVARDWDIVILRFAFLDLLDDRKVSGRFLSSLDTALSQHTEEVRTYLRHEADDMPAHGRLAIESGLATLETQADWVRKAQNTLTETQEIPA